MSPEIILATINARYSHAAFGLRWLWANMGALQPRTRIAEFTLRQSPDEIADSLLRYDARIIGFGVYIWNVTLLTEVARLLKSRRPDVVLVVGGPEVSHEYESTELYVLADYLIRGEGDVAFAETAARLLDGEPPPEKVIAAPLPDPARLELPYAAYTDEDISQRIVYVETSRGCPFRCAFCLSSLERGVREFPLEPFFAAIDQLLARGARQFKFVDRTFNLRLERMTAILEFFHARWTPGMRLHFEIVPDRVSEPMMDLFRAFPPGGLHLEAGIQSLNPRTLQAIGRSQDSEKALAVLARLKQAGAQVHADLIAGLPGETIETFALAFDKLMAVRPDELQVGILKRLRGAPLANAFPAAVFEQRPPYEVLETDTMSGEELALIKRFARYFDLYYNSGNFPRSIPVLWENAPSPFAVFQQFTDTVWRETGKTYGIPLTGLVRLLYEWLESHGCDRAAAAELLRADYFRLPGRRDKLPFFM